MFRLECFIDDKKLADVMRMLTGQVRSLQVAYVVNAEVKPNGQIKAATDGTVTNRVHYYLTKTKKKTEITVEDVRKALPEVGSQPGNASYCLNKMQKDGLVKLKVKGKGGQAGTWELVV